MLSRTVWKEGHAPVLDIELADPRSYGLLEPENRIIFLRTLLPYDEVTLSIRYQRMVAARMFRQLSELIPFIENHVVRIFPDFRSADGNEEFADVYGFPSLRMIPENIRSFNEAGLGSRSGIEGLFVANSESFPKLGSLGGTVAALEATAWIAHRSGLSGPLM
jgi:hypothetical protein